MSGEPTGGRRLAGWPWIARLAVELGTHTEEEARAALVRQREEPLRPITDFLEVDLETRLGILDRLKERPVEFVQEVEDRAFLRWAIVEEALRGPEIDQAMALAAHPEPARALWERLQDMGLLPDLKGSPFNGSAPYYCRVCRIQLEIPAEVVRAIEACPACNVAQPKIQREEAPEGLDPETGAVWLSDRGLALWAVSRKGLDAEAVAQAAAEAPPGGLAEALLLAGLLDLEDSMEALCEEVAVVCEGDCGRRFELGHAFVEFLPQLPCPLCQGSLSQEQTAADLPQVDYDYEDRTCISRSIGPYRLGNRLGHGESGDVYQAETPEGESVALKLLSVTPRSDEALARFETECTRLRALDHPNLVRTLGQGHDERSDQVYLALELVQGPDLSAVLEERGSGRLSPGETAYVMQQCAFALARAHEAGVVHGDLRASKVLTDSRGEIKLGGFRAGLADHLEHTLSSSPGRGPFTAHLTPADDVLGLGKLAYRLLTGEAHGLLDADEDNTTVSASPVGLSERCPDLPFELAELLGRMLSDVPAARPSALEVAESLDAVRPNTEALKDLWKQSGLVSRLEGEGLPPEVRFKRGRTFGPYRIDQLIGRGGMGVVYRVRHLKLKRTMALKLMVPRALTTDTARVRFLREAAAAGALDHPYVVPVIDVGELNGVHFLTMDYVEGKSLTTWAREVRDQRKVLELFARVCEGVHHAHSRGVIHRDLKPDNVLVDAEGRPHILDFGIAKRLDEDDDPEDTLTTQDDVLGTLRYMPPEQAAGKVDQVDTRSDVYALGSILYLLLCGRTPFVGAPREVLHQLHFEDARPPSSHPQPREPIAWELDAICLKAIEKDRDARYQSSVELRQDVTRFLEGRPILARQGSLGHRVRKWASRHRREVLVGVLGLVLASGLLGAWSAQTARVERARRQRVVDATLDGWRHFRARAYSDASSDFERALETLEPGEVLPLPALAGELLPAGVAATHVHGDRLAEWKRQAEQRRSLEEALSWLTRAERALAAGDLTEAADAARTATRLAPEDGEVRGLRTSVADALTTRSHTVAALAAADLGNDDALHADRLQRRLAEARADAELALELDPSLQEAGAVLVLVGESEDNLRRRLLLAKRHGEASDRLEQARAGLRDAEGAIERGDLDLGESLLRRARLDLTAALERWPEHLATKQASTRVALALAALWLRREKFELAEQELELARVYGLLEEDVAALEDQLRRLDEHARAFAARRQEGDALRAEERWRQAANSYALALEQRPDPQVEGLRELCLALVAAEEARLDEDLEAERAALLRASARVPDPRWGARLERLDAELYERVLARAEAARAHAAERRTGWDEALDLFEQALAHRPDGSRAVRGREDTLALRDTPPGMRLVSIPSQLLAQGSLGDRTDRGRSWRLYVEAQEITCEQFAAFVAAGGYRDPAWWSERGWSLRARFTDRSGGAGPAGWVDGAPPEGTSALPVTGVSFHEASAYAAWAGKRLPSEEEWVRAACFDPALIRLTSFPWGDDPPRPGALEGAGRLQRSPADALDVSPWGLRDMALNASEWVVVTGDGAGAAVRGLSWRSLRLYPQDVAQGVARWRSTPHAEFRDVTLGFRCVQDVAPPPPVRRVGGDR
jgi:serine/threonine protein kinase